MPHYAPARGQRKQARLLREVLLNLREARVVIEDWRVHYNWERPHSRLGYQSPEQFIQTQNLSH